MWLLYPFHRLLRKRRIPVSRALFSVPLGSLPLSRPLDSRYPPSRSPFHECSPRSKRSFRQSSSLPAGCCCIDESLRESRGNWMTATRREVSIRWFNQLARDASPSLSPILPSFLSFFCFWMAASVWLGLPIWFPTSQMGSYYTFFLFDVFLLRKLSSRTIVREDFFRKKRFAIWSDGVYFFSFPFTFISNFL